MKIQVTIRVGEQQKTFEIPCGVGDKSFKWLGQVASQRYAMSAPNGHLRRREDFCGATERVQFQATSITVPSGEVPYPTEMLTDYLRDGDLVVVELCDRQAVDNMSGAPRSTHYATLAYSISQEHLNSDLALSGYVSGSDDESKTGNMSPSRSTMKSGDRVGTPSRPGTGSNASSSAQQLIEKQSKVNYMRVVLKSQLLDDKRISNVVDQHWAVVQAALPLLKPSEHAPIRNTYARHWDLLKDLFKKYTNKKAEVEREQFMSLIEDANIFPVIQLATQSSLIFSRTCKHANSETINFAYFLLSLIFCAQLKYNDTLDPRVASATASQAVEQLVTQNLLPLARRLDCLSIFKTAFNSDDCLAKVRDHYDTLQQAFDKIATKIRDIPSTITVEEVAELFYQSTLLNEKNEIEKVKSYLQDIREGTIFGRDIDIDESNQEEYPISEMTFAEFVEITTRAGYAYYSKNPTAAAGNATPGNNTASSANLSSSPSKQDGIDYFTADQFQTQIIEYFISGAAAVCDFATGRKVRPPPVTKDRKGKKQ